MKKRYSVFLAVLLFAVSLWAELPEKISFQALVRNSEGQLVANQAVGMKISILQTAATGPAVYEETQTPTTNTNGMISLEIGGGTVVSGDFANIDWSAGPYFIKSETDPAGGTNYSITGASQLLSVPYALHAKTAGGLIENGHYVGKFYGGGVICYLDASGVHGLICSLVNLGESDNWSNINDKLAGALTCWDGAINTDTIVKQGGFTEGAAKKCIDYTNVDYGTGVYSDWFLPSLGEMNHLWNNIKLVHKALDSDGNENTVPLVANWYWTSTERNYGVNTAFVFNFIGGNSSAYNKSTAFGYVRAMRAF